jgi:putative transposase
VRTLAELSGEERERALARFHLIEPYLTGQWPLSSIAKEAGVPLRTAQRWVSQYRKLGLVALTRKAREDRGVRRFLSEKMREAIEGLALERPPLPATSIYRQVCSFADASGEPRPSYWMVYDLMRRLPANLVTLAHEGGKIYSETYDLVHRREASSPNAIWQADHSQLDILVLKEDGSVAMPWLTVVIDDHSRVIAGYYLAFDAPSSLRTSLALRQGIWRKQDPLWPVCGIPEVLYTDNGSDFTSHHLQQVAADLKMRLVFSLPGKPRGRGRIERFFRTLNEMFLCDLPGFGRHSRSQTRLTLPKLEEQLRAFLLTVYHRRPGAGGGTVSPLERWELGGFLPRMPESLEQLDLLLIQELRARKVRQDGIHFEGLRYLSTTLAAYVGEAVTIRFDPRDMGEIRVFHQDKFLCRAVAADLAGNAVPLRDILRARNRQRQELRSVVLDRQRAVDTLLEFKRGQILEEPHAKPPAPKPATVPLKRYRNE